MVAHEIQISAHGIGPVSGGESLAKTVVLATFGSQGDLHPYLALGLGLQARGCRAIIATHELYRSKVKSAGLGFRPLRPDYDPTDRAANCLAMDKWRGTENILREGLLPHLRDTYEDLLAAIEGADLMVSHTIVFAAPLVAQLTGIPWFSTVLAPIAVMSAFDPPHAFPIPWMNRIWTLGPLVSRAMVSLLRSRVTGWCEPIYNLRRELGLARGEQPLMEGQHSPAKSLALFSRVMGAPQPDWPKQMVQTGFPFYDEASLLSPELEDFLDSGPPPIVFTLGTAAVINPGSFFTESAKAVGLLGCRAVFLVGRNEVPAIRNVFVTGYAPFAQIFPRAAAIVHQGGIGTTGQCLRAGRPALIVPYAHDQPDNAARVKRLGAGLSLPLSGYTSGVIAQQLQQLEGCRNSARNAAAQIAMEDGVATACDALLSPSH